jgi:hypothetical protein
MSPDLIKAKSKLYGEEYKAQKDKFDSLYLLPTLTKLNGYHVYVKTCKKLSRINPLRSYLNKKSIVIIKLPMKKIKRPTENGRK